MPRCLLVEACSALGPATTRRGLHLNNRDDVGHYYSILREAAEQRARRALAAQRANRDPQSALRLSSA